MVHRVEPEPEPPGLGRVASLRADAEREEALKVVGTEDSVIVAQQRRTLERGHRLAKDGRSAMRPLIEHERHTRRLGIVSILQKLAEELVVGAVACGGASMVVMGLRFVAGIRNGTSLPTTFVPKDLLVFEIALDFLVISDIFGHFILFTPGFGARLSFVCSALGQRSS